MPYLDKDGLTTLWAKVKDTFALKSHTHTASEVETKAFGTYITSGETVDESLYYLDKAIASGGGSGAVSGVKGNAESSYRTGNVNLTAANIGAPVAPTNLYTNTSGTSGSFTLSSSIANFSVIEVFFKTNDGCMGCQKIWNNYSSSATFDLFDNHPYKATNTYLKCAHWSISGTSASVANPAEVSLSNGDAVLAYSLAAGIKITRVVGWKY